MKWDIYFFSWKKQKLFFLRISYASAGWRAKNSFFQVSFLSRPNLMAKCLSFVRDKGVETGRTGALKNWSFLSCPNTMGGRNGLCNKHEKVALSSRECLPWEKFSISEMQNEKSVNTFVSSSSFFLKLWNCARSDFRKVVWGQTDFGTVSSIQWPWSQGRKYLK